MVSAIAPKLNEIGFDLSKAQLYWLTAMPGLGGLLRLIFMLLPPIMGTRKLIGMSSLLYIIPMLGWFFAVQDTSTSFSVLFVTLSVLCGIGGGTFSGYHAFYRLLLPQETVWNRTGTPIGHRKPRHVRQTIGPLMGFGLLRNHLHRPHAHR